MMKKAVVDIDNTLWHFCDVLYRELKGITSSIPAPDHWTDWDFWKNYCTEDEFLEAIRRIQLNQDDPGHLPYAEARDFLYALKRHGFHIVIASHRDQESFPRTERWLLRHDLFFNELHLSPDKTVLFDETCRIVVDDSPSVLDRAAEKGILATGLLFPWNRGHAHNGFRLFNNLNDVLMHILDNSM